MNHLLQNPLIAHLGWALVHFLWQGIIVGMVYACLSRMLRHSSPQLRYGLALLTLLILMLLPLSTFFYLVRWNTESLSFLVPAHIDHASTSNGAYTAFLQHVTDSSIPYTAWVVVIWLSGVVLMAGRAFQGLGLAIGMGHTTPCPTEHPWQRLLPALIEKMQIKTPIRLIASAWAHTPMVVGWLKPAILIPPSAVCGLSWQQAEMILAHELAHIRRHDYLINLLQVITETLLFYHPVVHWISRDARNQREFCCDDTVMKICGDRVGYLKALTELEYGRLHGLYNVAASGGLLLDRAYRLARHPMPVRRRSGQALGLIAASLLISFAIGQINIYSTNSHLQLMHAKPGAVIHSQILETRTLLPDQRSTYLSSPLKLPHLKITPAPAIILARLRPLPSILAVLPNIQTRHIAKPQMQPVLQRTDPDKLAIIATQPLVQPAFPYVAWREGLGGTVQASFRINESGQVEDITTRIVNGPIAFAGAVRAAISNWKFEPVRLNNRVISSQIRLSFTFQADHGRKPDGHCIELTGSHMCHWYKVSMHGFLVNDAAAQSDSENAENGQTEIRLANADGRKPVFCQPAYDGCPSTGSQQNRSQIEQVLDNLSSNLNHEY